MKSKLTFLLLGITCIFITLSTNSQHANASSEGETIIYETEESTSATETEESKDNETILRPLSDIDPCPQK